MGIGAEAGFEVAGRLAQGGALMHMAIQGAFDGIEARREAGVDSVTRLVMRLEGSRRAQRAAEHRAAVAESELASALAELRLLREALVAEKRVTATLKEVCGL